jgi:site-specific recombinase XerD
VDFLIERGKTKMIGRIEQENKTKQKINEKLKVLPDIFEEFYNYLDSDRKSYGTIKHYIEYVSDFMDYVTDGDADDEFYKNVTVQQIREYIVSLRRRNENGTEVRNGDSIQTTRWSALNTFFKFLVMDDYIDVNPMTKTKRPKNKKEKPIVYLEQNEIDTIIDKIRAESSPKMVNRDLAIVILGIATGIRVGALTQINVNDIDFKNSTIHVYEKGDKERYIPFGPKVRTILSAWLVDMTTYFPDTQTDALFISQWRQRITTEGVRKVLQKYTAGIDYKHITPHTMRKTAATSLHAAGADIQTIADILGHESIQTTRRYAAVLDEDRQKAVNILDELF